MVKFKVGDRVKYVSGRHGADEMNPLVGSKYECVGTVIEYRPHSDFLYSVQWDNGVVNGYNIGDLEMVNTWDTLKAGQTIVEPNGWEHTVMAVVGDCVLYSFSGESGNGTSFKTKQHLIDNSWKIKDAEEVKLTINGKEVSLSAESVEAIRNVVRK